MTNEQYNESLNLTRSQKQARRYLLIFIAGMGTIPVFGVDPGALSVSAFLALVIFFLVKRQGLSRDFFSLLTRHPLFLTLWFLWLVLAVASGINSPILASAEGFEHVISWSRLVLLVFYFIFSLVIYLFFSRTEIEERLLTKAIAGVLLILIINMILVYFLYPDLRESQFWRRWPPGYDNIRHAGYHVVMVSVFFLALAPSLERVRHQLIFVALLSCFWAFNFWSGGRGSLIGALLGSMIFIGAVAWHGHNWKRPAKFLAASIVLGLLLAEPFSVFHWNGLLSTFDRSVSAAGTEIAASPRVRHWQHALDLIKENWFLGLGTGLYRFTEPPMPVSQPHNFLLQFFLAWGIPGGLCMLLMLSYLMLKGFKASLPKPTPKSAFSLACGAVVLTLLALALIDGTLYHTQTSFYFCVALVFWLLPGSRSGVGERGA